MKKVLRSNTITFMWCVVFYFLFSSFQLSFAEPKTNLSLSFLGDTMAHDVNFRIEDFSVVYAGVKEILLSDDLTFSNLEAPVDEKLPYKSYPRFNIHREYVQAAIDAGIEVFPLANNHSLDQDMAGIYQTLGSLMILRDENEMKIHFSGTRGNPKQEFQPIEIRKKGWRIGFISVTQFLNGYRRTPYIYIVDYRKEHEARKFLTFIRNCADDYDLFIVSFHAGSEYILKPEKNKIDFFRELVQAGVDIVYGHHPHVLQPYEEIEVDGCKKLILYSMGNFISGQRWASTPYDPEHYRSYTGDSLILKTDVVFTDQGPSINRITPVLITNHINNNREVVVETYENILNMDLERKWELYYKARYDSLNKLIATYGTLE